MNSSFCFLFFLINFLKPKKNKGLNGSKALGLLPEQTVWDYIIQLTSLIRAVHSANLAVRILSPSRILIDHKSRLRLSGVGIFDVIDYENSVNNMVNYQVSLLTNQNVISRYRHSLIVCFPQKQEDLTEFGRLVLGLACNSSFSIQKEHINTSIDIVSRNYSLDMRNLIM
jgi:PAB-dependent poly(A)-specific ribonuclease subunit 3